MARLMFYLFSALMVVMIILWRDIVFTVFSNGNHWEALLVAAMVTIIIVGNLRR